MNIKIYVDYKDGKKEMYRGQMKKSNPMSSIDFDYYIKFKFLQNTKKVIARVFDDDGSLVCCRKVTMPCQKYCADVLYFGITICGERIVSDTRFSLRRNDVGVSEIGYEIHYDPNLREDVTTRVYKNPDAKGCKILNEQKTNHDIIKLMSQINSL